MKYGFDIVDVFSPSPFGGNQLAVVMDAFGISSAGMQKIAKEFNFAETTFVLPLKNAANRYQVRIFTPKTELPFAGHPTVGTACALVMGGHVGVGDHHSLILEEGVGPILVTVEKRDGMCSGTMTLPGNIKLASGAPSNQDLAAVLSLRPQEVKEVFFAGVGVPFCFVQLESREAVDQAVLDKVAWTKHLANAWSANLFFFAGDLENDTELYARMFAPGIGIAEDPATGSAIAALVGALAAKPEFIAEEFRLSVIQGVAMGRRSEIVASARKSNGTLTSICVGGATSHVASGQIDVPRSFLSQTH